MPNYTGTAALIVGILAAVLPLVGVKLPQDFTGQATAAIAAAISAVMMLIGIWRLLFTKAAVATLSNQVVALGATPQAGPARDAVPTKAAITTAQTAVRKESMKP